MGKLRTTPLYEQHKSQQAIMMGFNGWLLPVWYTSVLDEHKAVRCSAGLFDVSHMGRVCVGGGEAGDLLDYLLTVPVQSLEIGTGRLLCLTCMENGGILDDLWVYRRGTEEYLLVWNACNTAQIDGVVWGGVVCVG